MILKFGDEEIEVEDRFKDRLSDKLMELLTLVLTLSEEDRYKLINMFKTAKGSKAECTH